MITHREGNLFVRRKGKLADEQTKTKLRAFVKEHFNYVEDEQSKGKQPEDEHPKDEQLEDERLEDEQ